MKSHSSLVNMLRCFLFLTGSILLCQSLSAQIADSNRLLTINSQIDRDVVSVNIISLDTLYGDDFVFSHGSGKVEGKAGWLTSVKKGSFISREHDSVKVELHQQVAILKGRLAISKKNKEKTDRYWLRYIRVFIQRNGRWQLVSHQTFFEVHE